MFWFDKGNPDVLFVDRREVEPISVGKGRNARMFSCKPDMVMDFRALDLQDDTFSLVVFDPPHLLRGGDNSYMVQKYSKLNILTWRDDLRKGFAECFRVLKQNGVLVFKWNESQIPLAEVLKLSPVDPLFGHPSGKKLKTHWVCFMKLAPTEGGKDNENVV